MFGSIISTIFPYYMKMKYYLKNLGDNYAFRSIVFGAAELLPLPEWLCAEEFFMHSLMQSSIW